MQIDFVMVPKEQVDAKRHEIRYECIRLADKVAGTFLRMEDLVKAAKTLEAYVSGDDKAPPESTD